MTAMSLHPLIFISHAACEDKDIASAFKDWIIKEYGLCGENVFVSSSPDSIKGRDFFATEISSALRNEDVMIVLLSKEAMKKRWIVFETGVGFGRANFLPPILCKGADINDLPEQDPLRFIQMKHASNKQEFEEVLKMLDAVLNMHHSSRSVEWLRKKLCRTTGLSKVPFSINDFLDANANIEPDFYHRTLM